MSKKLLGKITIDEYITGMFPCTCASFYSEKNKVILTFFYDLPNVTF